MTGTDSPHQHAELHGQYRPLYAAGFVTAFGAHSIAANLAIYGQERHATLTAGLFGFAGVLVAAAGAMVAGRGRR